MFYHCDNLKNIEVPSGVQYIEEDCFRDSGVEEVTLPNTLRGINQHAFLGCNRLRTVWAEAGCRVNVRKYVRDGVEVRLK